MSGSKRKAAIEGRMRGFKEAAAPTHAQARRLAQWVGACRAVYNTALEQRRDWWPQYKRQTGGGFTLYSQKLELKNLRAEFPWIDDVPSACMQEVFIDLDQAFKNFFADRKKPPGKRMGVGYPTRRKRGVNDSIRCPGVSIRGYKTHNKKWAALKWPKIGWIKFRLSREIDFTTVRNATLSRNTLGWHVSLACELPQLPANQCHNDPAPMAIGIDRGVAVTLAIASADNGETVSELRTLPVERLAHLDKRARRLQRRLKRKDLGSKRWLKAQRRVAGTNAKAARIRSAWYHEQSTDLARRFPEIHIEALKLKNMTKSARGTVEQPGRNVRAKSGLNRVLQKASPYQLEQKLAYKLAERGGELIKVNPAHTSQTCSRCGVIDAESRESQSRFACRHCGFAGNADLNAAVNISRRGTGASMRVEGA